jgi:ribose 5-phosphate isomerase B
MMPCGSLSQPRSGVKWSRGLMFPPSGKSATGGGSVCGIPTFSGLAPARSTRSAVDRSATVFGPAGSQPAGPSERISMRIALANDHAGFPLKAEIRQLLESAGHVVADFGTFDENACDLPDFVYPAALAVARGECERGIFVDGVGYGSAMIANKVSGIFAAVCQDPFCAGLARSHSDTNVLCLGAKIIGSALALDIVRVWLTTDYLGGPGGEEKYRRRVQKVVTIDNRHLRPLTEIDGPTLD